MLKETDLLISVTGHMNADKCYRTSAPDMSKRRPAVTAFSRTLSPEGMIGSIIVPG